MSFTLSIRVLPDEPIVLYTLALGPNSCHAVLSKPDKEKVSASCPGMFSDAAEADVERDSETVCSLSAVLIVICAVRFCSFTVFTVAVTILR